MTIPYHVAIYISTRSSCFLTRFDFCYCHISVSPLFITIEQGLLKFCYCFTQMGLENFTS